MTTQHEAMDIVRIHIGHGEDAWQSLLFSPQVPRGLIALLLGMDEAHLMRHGTVAALNREGLAVMVCIPEPGDMEGGAVTGGLLGWVEQMISVGRWLSEHTSQGILPLGIFGIGRATPAAAAAAGLMGRSLQGLALASADPDIAWSDLSAVSAPTLFLSHADDIYDQELDQELALALGGPSHVALVKAHGSAPDFPGRWFLRQFTKARMAADPDPAPALQRLLPCRGLPGLP